MGDWEPLTEAERDALVHAAIAAVHGVGWECVVRPRNYPTRPIPVYYLHQLERVEATLYGDWTSEWMDG